MFFLFGHFDTVSLNTNNLIRIYWREENMKNKIIGIFVFMLLVLSVYTVSATSIRMKDINVIEEVSNKGESNLIMIPYVHHMDYLTAYKLNSSQMFLCRVGNSGGSTESSPPFTLIIDVYTLNVEFITNLYTGDFDPVPIAGEIDPVVTCWDIVEPAGVYYVEAKVQFSGSEYEPVFYRWFCFVMPSEDSKVMPLKVCSTINTDKVDMWKNMDVGVTNSRPLYKTNPILEHFPLLQKLLLLIK